MPVSMAHAIDEADAGDRQRQAGSALPTIRPEIGEISTIISASGTTAIPASTGESPRTSCR